MTLECIQSVSQSTYENYRIIVIDNGSVERLQPRLEKEFPGTDYIYNDENLGFTGGCNQGMRHALERGADFIWLLNNDTIVPKECLATLVRKFEADKPIGLLSPVIQTNGNSNRAFYGGYLDINKGLILKARDPQRYEQWHQTEPQKVWLWGTALLINAELIRKIGYLDEAFFAYYEDNDYSLRSSRASFSNQVCLQATVFHKQASGIGNSKKAYYHFLLARNHYLFWKKAGVNEWSAVTRALQKTLSSIEDLRRRGENSNAAASVGGLWRAICLKDFGKVPEDLNPPKSVYRFTLVLAIVYTFFLRLSKRIGNRIRMVFHQVN